MRKEFLIMMTFYIAGLVFVNYTEPLSQTTCYIVGWLSYFVLFYFLGGCKKKMSKELTDAWKAGKLKALRLYYVLYKNGHIGKANLIQTPDYYGFWNNCDLNDLIKEVLALVPEYTEFVHLETIVARQAERIKELEQDVKTLTNNYKLLEKQQAENLAHGQALVDEFGDFETLYEELQNLRSLLKECDGCVRSLRARGVSDCNGSNLNDLLTRITTAIGESEKK